MDLLSKQGLRTDGRRPDQLRRIRCRMGVFSQPDGSVYLEQGNTKVVAAVYGPHEIRTNRSKAPNDAAVINCQYSMATFSRSERKRRPRDNKSAELTLHLKQAMATAIKTELYPKSQIDIFVEVLQSDGGNYSVCVNAATLALIDAGIAMEEFVISCTASLANGETALVDISHLEETMGGPNLTVAILPISGKIAMLETSQRIHLNHVEPVLTEAVRGCRFVYGKLNSIVKKHYEEIGSASNWGNEEYA
ncbi:exosome complex component RRP41 [Adelges cooleyi]|uniref:exosome complex component RRP41 n=1 Tax=Adelges cooleyi TaxID=133065 RepID=UPI00217F73C6|nr:exosome complex component RRP41 [Adelges cooleyi]